MSTRSFIGRENADGTITGSYCHFDGYLEGVGQTLLESYTDPVKVDGLIALGQLSVLGPELGEKQDFNDPRTQHPGWCLAYGRDRGDKNTEPRQFADRAEYAVKARASWGEYAYLWCADHWDATILPYEGSADWHTLVDLIAADKLEEESGAA